MIRRCSTGSRRKPRATQTPWRCFRPWEAAGGIGPPRRRRLAPRECATARTRYRCVCSANDARASAAETHGANCDLGKAGRSLPSRLRLWVDDEPVADAKFGDDVPRASRVDFELLAQAADIDAQSARVVAMRSPDLLDERCVRH